MIKNLSGKFDDLSKICDFNKYTMKYLVGVSRTRGDSNIGEEESEDKQLDVSEGQTKEISQLDSDDEDMEELAAKWVDDDDEDEDNSDDDDDNNDNSDDSDQE